ncbi:MAG: isoprenoid biosynthesis glyoxalase ElbB [Rhodospirillales bacterium]|nr:isoprenoid biosynthesis glyoxalase ElbB [Rhodospirillales bacterium]
MSRQAKVAVVLSGCGVYDGSEIHEAVLTLLALDRAGARARCFAPDIAQRHVIDHRTGKETKESRNVLVEAARIARGQIEDLKTFDAKEFDAILFPGGFGAAKNLSSFAFDGANCQIDPDVARAVKAMHAAKKPIGALCIAPTLIAKLLAPVEVTIGSDAGTAKAIESMGAHHTKTAHGDVVVDRANRVATSPCYMLDATISQIADGAQNTVTAVLEMVGT